MTVRAARRGLVAALIVVAGAFAGGGPALGHGDHGPSGRLPSIGPAPAFALTDQDGAVLALEDLKGKVVAVTFIYTSCHDVCPILTDKLADIRQSLDGAATDVHFVSITVDPAVDRPAVLKDYARMMDADVPGWSFLTGTETEIATVARAYGVYIGKRVAGDVDHNLLTSIIDRSGTIRVQYMGQRFSSDEFLNDLHGLVRENKGP